MPRFCVAAVLATLPQLAAAKGAGGAVAGGGYRSSRSGYYSRHNRYSYYPMMYYGGFYGRGGYYRGGRHGSGDGPTDEAGARGDNSIFCKRDVRLDYPLYQQTGFGHEVVLNSTRLCYNQMTTTHGAPENTKIENMYLDVFRWKLTAGASSGNQYPTVEMSQLNDKDESAPVEKSIWRFSFTKLALGTDATNYPSDSDNNQLDLSEFTWEPSPGAGGPKGTTQTWGYPFQTYLDQSKLTVFSITGTRGVKSGSTVDIAQVTLSFVLPDDFAEDAQEEHIFYRPSSLAIKVTIDKFPFAALGFGLGSTTPLGIHGFLQTHQTLQVSPGRAPAGKFGTEYDPKRMNRIEIGTLNDQETGRGRQYLAYRANFANSKLCQHENTQDCTVLASCGTSSTPGVCQVTGTSIPTRLGATTGMAVRRMYWYGQGVDSTKSGEPKAAWYVHMGTFDAAEQVAPTPADAADIRPMFASLLLCAFAAVFNL